MIKFYHSPHSRSTGTLWLLEELEIPYVLELININAPGGAPEAYRTIQPNKKVPAIVHDGIIITERAAITTYLCDAFPDNDIAPQVGDLRRGPYLSMLVYCDAVLDPVIAARTHGWTYKSNEFSFGLFDDMVEYLDQKLIHHRYATGSDFTAADVQLGIMLYWAIKIFPVMPEKESFMRYLDRLSERPAFIRALEKDQVLAKNPNSTTAHFPYDKPSPRQNQDSSHDHVYGDGFS